MPLNFQTSVERTLGKRRTPEEIEAEHQKYQVLSGIREHNGRVFDEVSRSAVASHKNCDAQIDDPMTVWNFRVIEPVSKKAAIRIYRAITENSDLTLRDGRYEFCLQPNALLYVTMYFDGEKVKAAIDVHENMIYSHRNQVFTLWSRINEKLCDIDERFVELQNESRGLNVRPKPEDYRWNIYKYQENTNKPEFHERSEEL